MSSRAIKTRRDDTQLPGWEPLPERAPSIVRQEQPTVARFVAVVGVFFILLGGLAMILPALGYSPFIGPGLGFGFVSLGTVLVLNHAFAEREFQFRRLYGALALLGIATALILRLLPSGSGRDTLYGVWFVSAGVPALFVSLFLLIATIRHETEQAWKNLLMYVLAGVGAVTLGLPILISLSLSTARVEQWLPGEGAVLMLLGILYVSAYIAMQDMMSEKGYKAGLALGAAAAVAVVGALVRTFLPDSLFFMPSGLILIGFGLFAGAIAAGTCLDWSIIVTTRRELASYFYSPVAYLVILGMVISSWFMFILFVFRLAQGDVAEGMSSEPIILPFIFHLVPVLAQLIIIPAITMRLFSEEHRTGTLEMMLTAPVNDWTVVLSKFLAAWFFFNLTWVPFWMYLIALRYFGGEPFDFRPVLSFIIVLAATSANFIAMGVFFSSLTKNQIIAAVLTFVGLLLQLGFYLLKNGMVPQGSIWSDVLKYTSYLDLWLTSLEGRLAPRYLVFHLSTMTFFLYLTTKVLESRKWK